MAKRLAFGPPKRENIVVRHGMSTMMSKGASGAHQRWLGK
jgi:hypothetical protein